MMRDVECGVRSCNILVQLDSRESIVFKRLSFYFKPSILGDVDSCFFRLPFTLLGGDLTRRDFFFVELVLFAKSML